RTRRGGPSHAIRTPSAPTSTRLGIAVMRTARTATHGARSHVTACAAKNTHPDTSKALHTGTAELARKTGFALACAAARALITSRVLQGLFHQRLRLGDAATFLFGQCALLRGARRDRDELVV